MNIVTKYDLVSHACRETGLTRKDCEEVIDSLLTKIPSILKEGKKIELRGFGTFKTKKRAEIIRRNPRNNVRYVIHERDELVFKFSPQHNEKVTTQYD